MRQDMRLVGLVKSSSEIVEDDIDRLPTLVVFTPAATQPLLSGSNVIDYGFQLDGGAREVTTVERELVAVLPANSTYNYHVTSPSGVRRRAGGQARIDRARRVRAIAAAVVLLLAAQAISVSSTPATTTSRSCGPWARARHHHRRRAHRGPGGRGRRVRCWPRRWPSPCRPWPRSGRCARCSSGSGGRLGGDRRGAGGADRGSGCAHRGHGRPSRPPSGASRAQRRPAPRRAGATRWAAAAGLPAPGVVGVGFALDRPGGAGAAPVRSALFGTAPGRGGGGHHADLRRQPGQPGLPPGPVRLELDLRPDREHRTSRPRPRPS